MALFRTAQPSSFIILHRELFKIGEFGRLKNFLTEDLTFSAWDFGKSKIAPSSVNWKFDKFICSLRTEVNKSSKSLAKTLRDRLEAFTATATCPGFPERIEQPWKLNKNKNDRNLLASENLIKFIEIWIKENFNEISFSLRDFEKFWPLSILTFDEIEKIKLVERRMKNLKMRKFLPEERKIEILLQSREPKAKLRCDRDC